MAKRKMTAFPGELPDVDDVMRWEQGEMNEEEMAAFFQRLIDSGMAWRLRGCYGRTAANLIKLGLCQKAN